MWQNSQRTGQRLFALAFSGGWLLVAALPAYAWDQASESSAPDYNAILAEKISSNHLMLTENRDSDLLDAALNPPGGGMALHSEPASVGNSPLVNRYSAGWNLPMNDRLRTGPVAQFAVDDSTLSCAACAPVDRNNAEHIASLGWRVDSSFGWISPWAQVSYSHQLSFDGTAVPRDRPEEMNRETNWMDVSVGARLPLGQNMAAFASFAQTGAVSSGEQFIYNLSVSASF